MAGIWVKHLEVTDILVKIVEMAGIWVNIFEKVPDIMVRILEGLV